MERLIIWNSWQSNSLIFVSFWHILFKGRVKVFFFFSLEQTVTRVEVIIIFFFWSKLLSKHKWLLWSCDFSIFRLMVLSVESQYQGFVLYYFLYYPLTPKSDQEVISPYNISSISRRQVMRIKKIIKKEISYDSTPNSQHLNRKEMYARQKGELVLRSWELKGPLL